jgi:hypothetical protein
MAHWVDALAASLIVRAEKVIEVMGCSCFCDVA